MGYRLQMSAEIHDWLTELRASDPTAAEQTAQALAALADGGDGLGPPLVTAVPVLLSPDELAAALDRHYQARLESLNAMRRRIAEAATRRRQLESQLSEPESQHHAGLRAQHGEVMETLVDLTETSRYEQEHVDAFRTRKEVLKATLTAAQVEQLLDPAGAAAKLDEITSQIESELNLEAAPTGLLELRPGAPADSGLRILFAVEPPGTALLIAVLEGDEAVRDHYREAVSLASEVLQEARAYRIRQASARTYADARSFRAEFSP